MTKLSIFWTIFVPIFSKGSIAKTLMCIKTVTQVQKQSVSMVMFDL